MEHGALPEFDLRLAVECAAAYSASTGLGCTVSDASGRILHESGAGCGGCRVCALAGRSKDSCIRAHAYGMTAAERFGGKYIYFCPMGLTCFVSPILGQAGGAAKITVGPFLMVDLDDYRAYDLEDTLQLDEPAVLRVLEAASLLPFVPPGKVNALSILLFLSVSFLNNVSQAERMLETQDSDAMQGRITEYILELKGTGQPPEYPIETERALLASIATLDKPKAQKDLNELLGWILFSSGGDFERIKARTYELLVLISRAVVEAGASTARTLAINDRFFRQAQKAADIDALCMLLCGVMNRYLDDLFAFSDVRHKDVIHKAVQFMKNNCARKLTLEETAGAVYLSPAYFSKVFKQEMAYSFSGYLNRLRIKRSERLLLTSDACLADISALSGFEDQSYFTKVFKRVNGVSPSQFRKSGGHAAHTGKKT